MWTGSVAFGLVNVPVKACGATGEHDVSLHQARDVGRIRYQRRCEVCGKRIDYDDMDKAYGLGDRTVVLTDGRAQECLAAKNPAGAPRVGASVLFLLGIPGDDEVREADFPPTKKKGKASAQGLRILLDEKLDDGDSPGTKGGPEPRPEPRR